jgi:hypothetical protein
MIEYGILERDGESVYWINSILTWDMSQTIFE